MGETHIEACISKHYNKKIQLSLTQIEAIASAIVSKGPGANVLIFGCGNDSMLWNALNKDGYTLFVENSKTWADQMKELNPDLNIQHYFYPREIRVSNSLPLDLPSLRKVKTPSWISDRSWDVILVDGPAGYKPDAPGRALPIYWSSRFSTKRSHVFVDDSERQVERELADHFLGPSHEQVVSLYRTVGGDQHIRWFLGSSFRETVS